MGSLADLIKKQRGSEGPSNLHNPQANHSAQRTQPTAPVPTLGSLLQKTKAQTLGAGPLKLSDLIKKQAALTDTHVQAAKAIQALDAALDAVSQPFHVVEDTAPVTVVRFAKAHEYPDALPDHLQELETLVNEPDVADEEAAAHQHVFDAEQDAAVRGMLEEKYCCLVGAAGTGKTYTLKRYLKALREHLQSIQIVGREGQETKVSLNIVFCSFIGRAVQQMRRVLPHEFHANCGTIHGDKVLAYAPEYYETMDDNGAPRTKMRFVPTFHNGNKLGYRYCVVDECGMLSVDLWNTLFDALRPDTEVKFIGDINQLPPVYGRSVLGFAMSKWPTFELKTPHRAALDNPITYNAHRILNGQRPVEMKNEHGEFIMVDVGGIGSLETQTKLMNLVKYANRQNKFDCATDTVITPVNKGPIGQLDLNALLVNYFNANQRRVLIKTGMGSVVFAQGDKVMMLANDKENSLTNGQIGVITSIAINGAYQMRGVSANHIKTHDLELDDETTDLDFDLQTAIDEQAENEESREAALEKAQRQASHIVSVQFEDHAEEVDFSTAGAFSKLAHGYAITCHKSQGGEYPTVIILCHSAHKNLLSREWLYTADTRGRVRVILIFNQRGLTQALSTQRIKGKTLEEKIASFQELSKNILGVEVESGPNLPAPVKTQWAENNIVVV